MSIKKSLIISICIFVITIFCLTFKQSYSYVLFYKASSSTVGYSTLTSFNTSLTVSGLNNYTFIPMSDEEGLNQEQYATISVSGASNTFFRLEMAYDFDNMDNLEDYKKYLAYNYSTRLYEENINDTFTEYYNLVPEQFIKIALFTSTGVQITQPVRLSSLPIVYDSNSTIERESTRYKIYENVTSSGSEDYRIKIWLSEDIWNYSCYNRSDLALKINVYSEPAAQKEKVILNGATTYNSTNNYQILPNVKIKDLVTGKSLTSSSNGTLPGNFTFYSGERYIFKAEYNQKEFFIPFDVSITSYDYYVGTIQYNICSTYQIKNTARYFVYSNGAVLDMFKSPVYDSSGNLLYYTDTFSASLNDGINTCKYAGQYSYSYGCNSARISHIYVNKSTNFNVYFNIDTSTDSVTNVASPMGFLAKQ